MFITFVILVVSVLGQGYEAYDTKNVYYSMAKSFHKNQRDLFKFQFSIGEEEIQLYPSLMAFIEGMYNDGNFESPTLGQIIGYVMVFFFFFLK
jgi:hypothetical protein